MFEDAGELLSYTNNYLDELEGRVPSSPEEALERSRKILSLISEMKRFNFHAPKFGIGPLLKELRFAEKEELLEAIPLLRKLMYSLDERKYAYERAKVAYLSNRLAYFSLKYENLIDFLPFLPYSGSYLSFTERGGGASYLVFTDLNKLLYGEKRISVTFEGEVMVEVSREGKRSLLPMTTSILVSSTSTSRSVNDLEGKMREELPNIVENYDEVVRYLQIVNRYDIKRLEENEEYLWSLLQELEEAGFLERDGTVREDILSGIKRLRAYAYRRIFERASSYVTLFLLKYYMLFPPHVRRSTPPLRGMPQEEVITDVLFSIDLPKCRAERNAVLSVYKEWIEVGRRVPLGYREVALHYLFKICPTLGKRYEEVERAASLVSRRERRAEDFLKVLEDEKGKDKKESGYSDEKR